MLDPANAEFVESIRSGTCPRELDPLDPSKHVSPAVLLSAFSVSCCRLQTAESEWRRAPSIPPRLQVDRCFYSLGSLRAQVAMLLPNRASLAARSRTACCLAMSSQQGAGLSEAAAGVPADAAVAPQWPSSAGSATDTLPDLWSQVTVNLVRNATDYVKPKYVAFGGQGQTLAGEFAPAQHLLQACLPDCLLKAKPAGLVARLHCSWGCAMPRSASAPSLQAPGRF